MRGSKRKDGTIFWGSIVITALHGDDKNVIGFTKVTRDLPKKGGRRQDKATCVRLEVKNKH